PDRINRKIVSRLQFLAFGSPDRVAAMHTRPLREGAAARARWAVFGPRGRPTIPPVGRSMLQAPAAQHYDDTDPSLFGRIGQPASLGGMAEVFGEGYGQLPEQIYPPTTPNVDHTNLQPFSFGRSMWPLNDRWHA